MNDACHPIRERLAGLEPLDEAAAAHVTRCAGCRALADALATVDLELSTLSAIEVPDDLVARTLDRVEALDAAPERGADEPLGLREALGALLSTLLSGLAAILALPVRAARYRGGLPAVGGVALAGVAVALAVIVLPTRQEPQVATSNSRDANDGWADEEDRGVTVTVAASPATVSLDGDDDGRLRNLAGLDEATGEQDALDLPLDGAFEVGVVDLLLDGRDRADAPPAVDQTTELPAGTYQLRLREPGYFETASAVETVGAETVHRITSARERSRAEVPAPAGPSSGLAEALGTEDDFEQGRARAAEGRGERASAADGNARLGPGAVGPRFAAATEPQGRGPSSWTAATTGDELGAQEGAAELFWTERRRTEALTFQPASGYWENTYLPGDPALRLLEARLRDAGDAGASALGIAEMAAPGRQPFDPPSEQALAIYVGADRAAADGPTRAVVQVGVAGSAHRGGRRPALDVGVVLDLRAPLGRQDQARVRALLEALSRARDTADRMSLTVAGPGGGVVVPTGALRYGEIAVALADHFGDERPAGPVTSLPEAMRLATAAVGATDDPTAPRGASVVILVTPGRDGRDLAVERLAHVGALAGVTTTVVGLGAGADLAAIDPIALAGQGRRRVLADPAEARTLVDAEVAAVSRVVARAVRLRIRLAPGVRLVDVLGSRRLGADQAQRVREGERAADRELAARLGITADRGEDEDGIQIVIPAFYADDVHVILLDVVVPGPGPVADVRARFKDLVRLRNGVADGSLRLAPGERPAGALERNVIENLLAHRMTEALEHAAQRVSAGDPAGAAATLDAARATLAGVRAHDPSLAAARALTADLELAARYAAALGGDPPPTSATLAVLHDSMLYAARRRSSASAAPGAAP